MALGGCHNLGGGGAINHGASNKINKKGPISSLL
jgi:hypothetical protein